MRCFLLIPGYLAFCQMLNVSVVRIVSKSSLVLAVESQDRHSGAECYHCPIRYRKPPPEGVHRETVTPNK